MWETTERKWRNKERQIEGYPIEIIDICNNSMILVLFTIELTIFTTTFNRVHFVKKSGPEVIKYFSSSAHRN